MSLVEYLRGQIRSRTAKALVLFVSDRRKSSFEDRAKVRGSKPWFYLGKLMSRAGNSENGLEHAETPEKVEN